MLSNVLLAHRANFLPIVPFTEKEDKIVRLDLSENNKALTPEIFENTALFSDFIDSMLQQAGARYGIGGYLENRKVYARSRVFDAGMKNSEPRTLHLGLDIWGKAGTPVMAPMEGIVHSKGNHTEYGNYGATIILQHQLGEQRFYTLYGHLSFIDLEIEVGSIVSGGEVFAHFGVPEENGQWPPHLHFQVIENLEGNEGDYPGVCATSQKERFAYNCPNPGFIVF
jgi:murein DD-endopeptidase MepM/ murein hydrolase activator NlpD